MATDQAQVLVLAAVLGVVGTWLARALARHWNVVNEPNPIVPQHVRPTAYFGGVGLALGMGLALAILAARGALQDLTGPSSAAMAAGAVLYLFLGLLDDIRPLRPAMKFGLQVVVAGLVVVLGLVLPLTGLQGVDGAVTVFWIVAVVNAVNFTDVCDGLVAGLAVLWSCAFVLVTPEMGPLWLTVAGACLGCLVFNAPPASIFLGDAGSHLLGFCLAAGTVHTVGAHGVWPGAAVAALAGGVPLFELVFITGVRIRKGLPWWRGSPDHFSLRLQAAGLSRWRTDVLAWAVAAALGLTAVLMLHTSFVVQVLLVVLVAVAAYTAWRLLQRWEVTDDR